MNRCLDCDETFPLGDTYCRTCGARLVKCNDVSSNPQPTSNPALLSYNDNDPRNLFQMGMSEAFMEMFGEDMISAISEAMAHSSPNRMVSQDYFKKLSKVEVDKRKSILLECTLQIGPLKVLTTISNFGFIPEQLSVRGNIVLGSPECGESPLHNAHLCKDSIVVLNRGVVSFVEKAIRAQEAGAIATVIIQTGPSWPYVMTDSSNVLELKYNNVLSIPVVMIGEEDGKLVMDMINNNKKDNLLCTLSFGAYDKECPICHECYEEQHVVIKLPCRHLYHSDCLHHWLKSNNTCPLCRSELPKASAKEREEAQHSTTSESTFSNATSQPYFR